MFATFLRRSVPTRAPARGSTAHPLHPRPHDPAGLGDSVHCRGGSWDEAGWGPLRAPFLLSSPWLRRGPCGCPSSTCGCKNLTLTPSSPIVLSHLPCIFPHSQVHSLQSLLASLAVGAGEGM